MTFEANFTCRHGVPSQVHRNVTSESAFSGSPGPNRAVSARPKTPGSVKQRGSWGTRGASPPPPSRARQASNCPKNATEIVAASARRARVKALRGEPSHSSGNRALPYCPKRSRVTNELHRIHKRAYAILSFSGKTVLPGLERGFASTP